MGIEMNQNNTRDFLSFTYNFIGVTGFNILGHSDSINKKDYSKYILRTAGNSNSFDKDKKIMVDQ